MIKKHQRPTQKLRQGGIIEREGAAPPLERDAGGSAASATSRPGSACRCWRTARRSGCARRCGEIDRQGVRAMADAKKADKPEGAPKAAGRSRPGRQARRPRAAARAARAAATAPRRAGGQARAGHRRGPAAAARPLPDGGGPGPHEGAGLHEPVPGAAAREDRHQHGAWARARRTRRCWTSPPPTSQAITGQKPVVTRAKKSIANFKLRENVADRLQGRRCAARGCTSSSTGSSTWPCPRVRDFKGVPPKAFDGRGNYALGLKEQIIFPEIVYDKIDKVRGMDIIIVTTAADRRGGEGAPDAPRLAVPGVRERAWRRPR